MYTASATNSSSRQEVAPPPVANGALCLSTPKYNDESGTVPDLVQALQEIKVAGLNCFMGNYVIFSR